MQKEEGEMGVRLGCPAGGRVSISPSVCPGGCHGPVGSANPARRD